MTGDTFNFLVRVFGITIAAIFGVIVGLFVIIIVRDGSNPLVQETFSNIITLTQWLTGIIGGMLILHPITTGVQNLLVARANVTNTRAEVEKATALNITTSTNASETPAA